MSILSEVQRSLKAVSDFYNQVLEATSEGQDAVNALVWPVLEDEVFRSKFENALYMYTWSAEIRVSVFTSPVLDKECVETIFEGAEGKSHFKAIETFLLLEREDFEDELFGRIVSRMSRNNIVDAVLFLDDLNSKEMLTLGRLLEVYYLSSKEESLRQARWMSLPNQTREVLPNQTRKVESVKGYVLSKIYSHYPDMPASWVQQMLRSLKTVEGTTKS